MMTTRFWNAIVAINAVLVTYGVARAADLVMLRVVHPPRGDVLLVSDMVLATAFGVAIDMWLNLRAARAQVTGLERVQIVVDTQLALAAQIQRRLLPSASDGSKGVRWRDDWSPRSASAATSTISSGSTTATCSSSAMCRARASPHRCCRRPPSRWCARSPARRSTRRIC